MGLNEAKTLESNSILIHSHQEQGNLYTKWLAWCHINQKSGIKRREQNYLVSEVNKIMKECFKNNYEFLC